MRIFVFFFGSNIKFRSFIMIEVRIDRSVELFLLLFKFRFSHGSLRNEDGVVQNGFLIGKIIITLTTNINYTLLGSRFRVVFNGRGYVLSVTSLSVSKERSIKSLEFFDHFLLKSNVRLEGIDGVVVEV